MGEVWGFGKNRRETRRDADRGEEWGTFVTGKRRRRRKKEGIRGATWTMFWRGLPDQTDTGTPHTALLSCFSVDACRFLSVRPTYMH